MARLLTRGETAEYIGVSSWTLRNWVRDGLVRPTLRTAKRWYWSRTDAEAILRQLDQGGDTIPAR